MLPRLNRLFAADGRCFDVAVDHGFFGEGSFLTGIEDIAAAVATLVAAGPDAIQLSPGQARHLQHLPGPKPALVLRTDVANVYAPELPRVLYSEVVADAVGAAVRLDAACVVVNLLLLPDQPELHRACVRNVSALRAACDARRDAADGRAAGDEERLRRRRRRREDRAAGAPGDRARRRRRSRPTRPTSCRTTTA